MPLLGIVELLILTTEFITKFQSNIYTYIYTSKELYCSKYTYKLLLVVKSIHDNYIHIYETRIRRRLGL